MSRASWVASFVAGGLALGAPARARAQARPEPQPAGPTETQRASPGAATPPPPSPPAASPAPGTPETALPPPAAPSPPPAPGSGAPPAARPPRVREANPDAIGGIDLVPKQPLDYARNLADAVLLVPRQVVDSIFFLTGTAASVVHDQQVVPRLNELLSPRPGTLVVYPTAFVETGRKPSVGARFIAAGPGVTSSLRAGFGGVNEVVGESRLLLSRPAPLPAVLSLEAFADRRTDLQFLGLGQAPESDPRNRFIAGIARTGLYREQRARLIGSLGVRPSEDVELFLSTSVTRRYVDDAPGTGIQGLSQVFQPGSLPGAFSDGTVVYTEGVLRLDTRASRGLPSPGWLLEAYGGAGGGGYASAIPGDPARQAAATATYLRVGGRAAAFWTVYRKSNILSPKLVIDGLAPTNGVDVPFTELPGQPEFRGFDTRRDRISMVGSVDYRWTFIRSLAARVFADAATVAPSLKGLGLDHLRLAAGVGLDVSSSSAEIGRFALSVSPDGLRFLLSLGVPSGFGDRQHRD